MYYFFFTNICFTVIPAVKAFSWKICYIVSKYENQSVLMSYFTRHLYRLVKFWHRRKKWKVDSASKLRE